MPGLLISLLGALAGSMLLFCFCGGARGVSQIAGGTRWLLSAPPVSTLLPKAN